MSTGPTAITVDAHVQVSGPANSVRLHYRPELDGLRGLAILAVLAFHAGFAVARAGFLGVDLFFGLSGFLITSLLIAEHAETGTVKLLAFYERRALRLLPALMLLLAVVVGYAWCRHLRSFHSLARTGFYALLYVENWANIYAPLTLSPWLDHLWSLSVEEQFYLVWPMVLAALLPARPRWLISVLAAGIVLSMSTRIILFAHGAAIARVYKGSDTRADVILGGCLLAVLRSQKIRVRPSLAWTGLGLALAWILLTRVPLGFYTPRLYREGFSLIALGVFCSLALVVDTRPQWLQWRPLVWLGTVSYSLYLWQVPLAGLLRNPVEMIFASLVAASVSHYALERPCLRLKAILSARAVPGPEDGAIGTP